MSQIPEIELRPGKDINAFQEAKLAELLRYLALYSPFYQRHFQRHNIQPGSIRHLGDMIRIPPTTKDDIQQHNWDFLCVPKKKLAEYTSTSGTLGKPVTIALTAHDLERLAYNEYISFSCAGATKQDLFQLMLTLDRQFMAGIAYYAGIRKIGAGLVRTGPGLPALQWSAITQLKTTSLVAVPSFIVKLVEYANQNGIDLQATPVRKAVCIGESLRKPDFSLNTLGKRIADNWNIQLYSTYASTEMQTAFTECSAGVGGHHHPELIIVEILDDQDQPVGPGIPGEVTVTTLGVEGMPLLRYKTGDIAAFYDEPCSCGRKTLRLGPVAGRKQHMIKLKGTTLYPPGIFDVLNSIKEIMDYTVEVYAGPLETDELRLHLVLPEGRSQGVIQSLTAFFQSRFRVVPEIVLCRQDELTAMQFSGTGRKVTRFIDRRRISL